MGFQIIKSLNLSESMFGIIGKPFGKLASKMTSKRDWMKPVFLQIIKLSLKNVIPYLCEYKSIPFLHGATIIHNIGLW